MTKKRTDLPPPPPCDPDTLMDIRCVDPECGRLMHKVKHHSNARACAAGHPRHSGRGLCGASYSKAQKAGRLTDHIGVREERDAEKERLLAEWDWVRADWSFDSFGKRMGVLQSTWAGYYSEALADGDPRARGRSEVVGRPAPTARLRLPGSRR